MQSLPVIAPVASKARDTHIGKVFCFQVVGRYPINVFASETLNTIEGM